ncbi:MAG: futalosine hydrolase [Bacteroidales bacterium]|nr:futalosine hydrolase [Bacteroidales bacterium]
MELDPLIKRIKASGMFNYEELVFTRPGLELTFLVSGIGTVLTTFHLTKVLVGHDFDFVLNLGIAGSFVNSLKPGEVISIREEVFADIGVEDEGSVKTLSEAGLMEGDMFPFRNGRLASKLDPSLNKTLSELRQVKGITVNIASGSETSAMRLFDKFHSEVESMEGAAVFYTCLMKNVDFAEIRAISNVVGERNKLKWKVPEAIAKLADVCYNIILGFIKDQ